MEKMTKEQRALIVNEALDKAGIQNWGRAGIIKRSMGCSPATASGWLRGTLPKDAHQLVKFSNTYGLNVDLWVNGESKAGGGITVSEKKAETMCSKLREFESDTNRQLSAEQFGKLFVLLCHSEEKANFLLEHGAILNPTG